MRVLLVEDDSATAQSIEMMLRSESYVCDTTDMGEDGLEIGKLYDYDIIVLDLMLPDIDGYEVLRRLRAARVQTPILILSGLSGLDDKIKGLGVGADDYDRWVAAYGDTEMGPSAGVAAPEPAAFGLALAACSLACASRRRK